jgi:hypothetical protein
MTNKNISPEKILKLIKSKHYNVPIAVVVFDSVTLERHILAIPKSEIFGFIS